MFKIGSTLFTLAGPQVVKDIIGSGAKVFLDLKFHDIPHQVAGAARSAAELDGSLFTIHAGGLAAVIRRPAESVNEVAGKGRGRPSILPIGGLTPPEPNITTQTALGSTA